MAWIPIVAIVVTFIICLCFGATLNPFKAIVLFSQVLFHIVYGVCMILHHWIYDLAYRSIKRKTIKRFFRKKYVR